MSFKRKFASIHMHTDDKGTRYFTAVAEDGSAWVSKVTASDEADEGGIRGVQARHWIRIIDLPQGED